MIALSKRQYAMLLALIQTPKDYLSIEQAQRFDQRPFRSMLIQKWVAWKPGKGFHVTKEGMAAWDEYHQAEIGRKDPSAPLTKFFNPAAYGLAVARKATA